MMEIALWLCCPAWQPPGTLAFVLLKCGYCNRGTVFYILLLKKIVFTFSYFKLLLVASGYHIGDHSVELF